jgi:hypothetical protein
MTLGTISSKSSKTARFFLLLEPSSELSGVSTEASDLLLLLFELLRE